MAKRVWVVETSAKVTRWIVRAGYPHSKTWATSESNLRRLAIMMWKSENFQKPSFRRVCWKMKNESMVIVGGIMLINQKKRPQGCLMAQAIYHLP